MRLKIKCFSNQTNSRYFSWKCYFKTYC